MICQNCQANLIGAPKFCPRCGTRLSQSIEPERQSKRCPQCGTKNEFGAKFCKHDGYRFDPQPAVIEEAEPPAIQAESELPSSIEQTAIVIPPEKLPETPAAVGPEAMEDAKQDIERAPPRICPRCGTANASTALYCRKDGMPLTASEGASVATNDLGADSPYTPEAIRDNTAAPVPKTAPQPKRFVIPIAIAAIVGLTAVGYFVMPSDSASMADKLQPDNREAESAVVAGDRATPTDKSAAMAESNASTEKASLPSPVPQAPERTTLPRPQAPVKAGHAPPKDLPPLAERNNQPPPARVDAALLHRTLTAQLARSGLGHLEVTVDSEGRAGLAGLVSSSAQKEAAISIAFAQQGIEYVSDTDLKVVKQKAQVTPTPAPTPSTVPAAATQIDPARIEGEINRALRAAGLGSIAAQVADDLSVTLRGSVTSTAQKTRAFQIAQSFKGVRATKDRIFVVN